MQGRQRNIFITGIVISSITAICLLSGSFLVGKDAFFLALNTDLGPVADQVFKYWTFLGDGIIWLMLGTGIIIFRKQYLPLIIAALLISTLITQGTKNFVFPGEPRPTYGLIDIKQIHTVPGVELHTVNSFPSGHTGTAFTVFLIGCLLIRKWWIVPVGFFYAAMVGYSRIYLAQHFPLDVGAGILTGIITTLLSYLVQQRWSSKYTPH